MFQMKFTTVGKIIFGFYRLLLVSLLSVSQIIASSAALGFIQRNVLYNFTLEKDRYQVSPDEHISRYLKLTSRADESHSLG